VSDSGSTKTVYRGVFWIVYGPDGSIAHVRSQDEQADSATDSTQRGPESNLKNPTYALLEDHEGTMWFGTAVRDLLKFDREHRRFISYHNLPGDSDSLLDNRVIALFEDREKKHLGRYARRGATLLCYQATAVHKIHELLRQSQQDKSGSRWRPL